VEKGNWVFDATKPYRTEAVSNVTPNAVWQQLLALLERQSLEAGQDGGAFGVQTYREAQYAMAALADEVFLRLDWDGREAWQDHLLEFRLFQTHCAGEELFERIEKLLRDGHSAYKELARVYLIVLGLGFEGKYYKEPEIIPPIASYRRRLFSFVFGHDPLAVRGREQLMPQAYSTTLNESDPSTLPYVRPWLLVIAAVLLLWLVGAHWIWDNATAKLESDIKVRAEVRQ
jgi:type VI secretion system protein ImpK